MTEENCHQLSPVPTSLTGEQLPQGRHLFDLLRVLSEQLRTAGKRAEKLAIKIVAVRQHHQRWVLQFLVMHQYPGEERHQQTLARALRVPDDTRLAVARERFEHLLESLLRSVVLMAGR